MNKSWTSHEQVVNKSGTSPEQGDEQVMKRSWTSCEQVIDMLSWTSHQQFHEKIEKKLSTSCE